MSNLRKVIYLVLVIYLGFRGYQIFFAEKPEPENIPSISEEERQEKAEAVEHALEALKGN